MLQKIGEQDAVAEGADQISMAASMLKKNVLVVTRFIVSVALIVYLLSSTNINDLRIRLQSLQIPLFVITVALGFLRIIFFALRWKLALSVVVSRVSLIRLIKYYLIGSFYNLFLPTVLGGDVVRGYDFAVDSGKTSDAVISVIVERVVGLFTLVIISFVAVSFGWPLVRGSVVVPIVFLFGFSYMFVVLLLFSRGFTDRFFKIALSSFHWKLLSQIHDLIKGIQAYASHIRVICGIFLLSLIAQVLDILGSYLLAMAIGLEISQVFFYIAMPMIWIVTMFPLSINGLGVREGAFIFFFSKAGASPSAALSLSFMYLAQIVMVGLTGGIVHLGDQVTPLIRRISKKITP